MERLEQPLHQLPMNLRANCRILPTQVNQAMRIARVRPNHPSIVDADPYRLGDLFHTLDHRGTLLGRLVLQTFIYKNRLGHTASVPVGVEIKGAPFDGDGVVAAAWVGFAVQGDGAVEAAFADVAPLGLGLANAGADGVLLTGQMKSKTTSISITVIVWWVLETTIMGEDGVIDIYIYMW